MNESELFTIEFATSSNSSRLIEEMKNILEKRRNNGYCVIVGNIKYNEPIIAFQTSGTKTPPKKINTINFKIELNNDLNLLLKEISSEISEIVDRHIIYKKEDEDKYGYEIYYVQSYHIFLNNKF